jgi:hypothetical protein
MKKLVALMIPVPLLASLFAACSSDDTAQTPDASADVTPDKKPIGTDSAPPDAASGCAPADISTFKPTWVPPNDPQPTACSDKQINDYFANCYDATTSNNTACSNWLKANAACNKCMITADTAAKYAALISSEGVTTANIGGCIALKDGDKSDTGCGAKYLAAFECGRAACADNCPIPSGDNAAFKAYQACLTTAAKGVCKTYEAAKCKSADAGDAIDYCLNTPTGFEDFFKSIGAVFCGGYPAGTDAGTDAASDASDASADAPDDGG